MVMTVTQAASDWDRAAVPGGRSPGRRRAAPVTMMIVTSLTGCGSGPGPEGCDSDWGFGHR